ncbi:Farnesyl diphosphate synthase [Aeoliella mucimassa]|uniref:Farnesyl diphosphate synthase n=2 Tax=Aeoliella mucimassa TaxID=2527972 RepID=A0A518AKF4_9BACT|nr:Farnesyl diphosphate synthase [Aeoliella mucimassa]
MRGEVEQALDQRLRFDAGCPERLSEAMRYAVLAPGKRLRPLLAMLAAKACGGTIERAMPAACAVEMIHAYSLVHDDLPAMDDDDLRRGMPTCHRKFDEATAILVGDALQARAFEVLATELTPASVAARACAALGQAAGATLLVGGQADDLAGAAENNSRERLEAIHHRKTAAMILVSLELGALTAEASDTFRTALAEYGRRFGLVFQITDDLLDAHGQEQQVGKRLGKDAEHGKLTYVTLVGVDESRRLVAQLVDEAIAALAPLGEKAEPLKLLARMLVDRKK